MRSRPRTIEHLEDTGARGAARDGHAHRLRELAELKLVRRHGLLKGGFDRSTRPTPGARSSRAVEIGRARARPARCRCFAAGLRHRSSIVVGDVEAQELRQLDQRLGALAAAWRRRASATRRSVGTGEPACSRNGQTAVARAPPAGVAFRYWKFTHWSFSGLKTAADFPTCSSEKCCTSSSRREDLLIAVRPAEPGEVVDERVGQVALVAILRAPTSRRAAWRAGPCRARGSCGTWAKPGSGAPSAW